MKNDDFDTMLGGIEPPKLERIAPREELKIPLLSYRRSSKAGLWLLILPALAALTYALKYELAISSPVVNGIRGVFAAVDGTPVLRVLIPVVLIGFPFTAMVANLLAFTHFSAVPERRELLITVKYRPASIVVFLLSFAALVFFLLPDRMSF